MATDSRLEHQTLKVRQLVDDFRAGRIVIPEFQRDYVWQKSKSPRLIDSLYRGFPISSLLLWRSAEETRSRRRDPRPARSALMDWLIDGQQRIITLSRTMSGDEGIEVVFHPEREEFGLANAATRQDPNWIRVADLWDDDLYRQLRRNLDGSRNADKREERFESVRRILDYEIPVVGWSTIASTLP
jgi:hypothetical protein